MTRPTRPIRDTWTSPRDRAGERGQVIVLFALAILVFLGIGAFVLDVARAYALQQSERSVADAAALAGAQDLQVSGSRAEPTETQRVRARTDALNLLIRELGGSASLTDCSGYTRANLTDPTTMDYVDCPIVGVGGPTPYLVSVKTPSPSAVTVEASRAVQVTVRQPTFSTTFARLFGQGTWNVGSTSVAGGFPPAQYALVTLQPPNIKHNGSDANLNKDLIVSGDGTLLNIIEGDVGTNTSATTNNQGSTPAYIQLAPCYRIDHVDDLSLSGITWYQKSGTDCSGKSTLVPQGNLISSLIPDPNYPIAQFPAGTPTFTTQAAGALASCSGSNFPSDWTTLLAGATCYNPGVYNLGTQPFTVGSQETAYLMPGAYYFPSGLQVNGTLAGGLISDAEGVVLLLPENLQSGGTATLNANNAVNFLLNVGDETLGTCNPNTDLYSCRAAPAVDYAGVTMESPDGFPISIEVQRDDACFSGTTPLNNASCATQHNTVNLAGSGTLQVAGVIYGPSDNMSINGNSSQTGLLGQLISWTATYTGGSTLQQEYPGKAKNYVLRLDTACSGPGTQCNP